MGKAIQWKRSEEGSAESHCGRFSVEPRFRHTINPSHFSASVRLDGQERFCEVAGCCDTQRDAKQACEDFVARVARQLVAVFALREVARPCSQCFRSALPGRSLCARHAGWV